MGKPLNLTGERYGRLVVQEKTTIRRSGQVVWLCRCDCGKYCKATTGDLRSGRHSSCGCYQKELVSKLMSTHGESKTRLYGIWCAMIKRCENKNGQGFENYGGRGISVCPEWRNDYVAFRDWSMLNGYSDNLSIDRIDVDGDYCPENCRWSDRYTQMNNTRRTRQFEYKSEVHTLREWSDITGISFTLLKGRLQRGWSFEKTLTTEKQKNQFG